jgi:hypothetical protein
VSHHRHSLAELLTLLSLLFEQRRRRDPKISRGALGKPCMPFVSRQFTFERYEHDIAQRTLVLLRVAPQALK